MIFRRQRHKHVNQDGEPAEFDPDDKFDDLASAWSAPTPQILFVLVIAFLAVAVIVAVRLWPS